MTGEISQQNKGSGFSPLEGIVLIVLDFHWGEKDEITITYPFNG